MEESGTRVKAGLVNFAQLAFAIVWLQAFAGAASGKEISNLPSKWLSTYQTQISDLEYAITWQSDTGLPDLPGAWHAPNRANNLRTYFVEDGIVIHPRKLPQHLEQPELSKAFKWEWGLAVSAFGEPNNESEIHRGTPEVIGNRIEYRHQELTEWYVNSESGIEQGFTIERPPRNDARQLRLSMRVNGNLKGFLDQNSGHLEFISNDGVSVLTFGKLRSFDAHGQSLESNFSLAEIENGQEISVTVNVAHATYPITIDPLAGIAEMQASGDADNQWFGRALVSDIDVNGDGYHDLIIAEGVPRGTTVDLILNSRIRLYLGGPDGISSTAVWSYSNPTLYEFSGKIISAGDINADGYDDVAFIAALNGTIFADVLVFYGSATGFNATPDWTLPTDIAGNHVVGRITIAADLDVNGDTFDDLILGLWQYTNGQDNEGQVSVFYGSSNGLQATAGWAIESNIANHTWGSRVASVGDINNDGYDDFGAALLGRLSIFLGGQSGPGSAPVWEEPLAYASGGAVTTIGDVNNDGINDLLIGQASYPNPRAANGAKTSRGAVFLYLGTGTGLSQNPDAILSENSLSSSGFGQEFGTYGLTIDSGEDINGDGYDDLVVCDYERENQDDWSAGGTCFLYAGESGGLNPDAIWVEESDSIAAFGHSVALANDINGDGFPDLIVGAPQKNSFGQIDNGRVYFFYGGNEQTVNGFEWKTTSNQAGAQLGYAVASAGDVNGDGFSDVLVGAPFFDNGQQDEGKAFLYLGDEKGPSVTHDWSVEGNQIDARLGISVATAGDVNGDEFSDVIIGASKYSNGVPDEGAAFIFHGSQSGLNQVSDRTISGNQSNALFGWMVGSAGDVDADGYGDIFVTARHYDNGHNNEGRVYLFEGSATGIGSSAAWQFESNQPGAQLGYSAALLGDVNGDGFSDVIFGAPFHDLGGNNAGRVFAFHGSINGLNNTPDWTQVSNQANAWFGRSVSSAGDVNGDGYSDVLVGAPNFDSGQINEGVAYLFAGSASGITDTSSWEGQIDQPDAKFGWSVNFAGDLNADGFGDVTIGAPFFDNGESDEGGVFIYYGSPSFFPAEPSAIYESNQSGANLGFSVALAGDVNNDGFSDLIGGARFYVSDSINGGGAFLVFGSARLPGDSPDWMVTADLDATLARRLDSAGDVNGDGFVDIISGEFQFANGEVDEGRALIYYGGINGPNSVPDWSIEGNSTNLYLGLAVAGAGDVNGDGFGDVLVTAGNFDGEAAIVFLHLGSASGPDSEPQWQMDLGWRAHLGGYVATSAGDVNGDGYADVLLASDRDSEVYVFQGGPTGLQPEVDWMRDDIDTIGIAGASAGDVNGDGYSDIVVSSEHSPFGDAGGGAYVFFGSANGISGEPIPINGEMTGFEYREFGHAVAPAGDNNGDGYSDFLISDFRIYNGHRNEGATMLYDGASMLNFPEPAWRGELNSDGAHFGWDLDSLGDINGDGLDDFIIAAEGRNVFDNDFGGTTVFLGSKTTPAVVADWYREQVNIFNSVVSGLGDINGDGYNDVLMSEEDLSEVPNAERRFMLFYGNRAGFPYEPQQRNEDNSRTVPVLGKGGDSNRFHLQMKTKSPFARSKVKLEWEIKPAHIPFDGSQLSASQDWFEPADVDSVINEAVTNLADDAIYHWRMRLRFDVLSSPIVRNSRWFTSGARAEGDIRIRMDTDHDGLADVQEEALCSNGLDVDSDDDGIADGDEDANRNGVVDENETDPCSRDTDSDGIQDGTEIGLSAGILDPDGNGILLGTNLEYFIPDADAGLSFTDPTNSDSDGDGFEDGVEDANQDGEVDDGESDPNNISSTPNVAIHTVTTVPTFSLFIFIMLIIGLATRKSTYARIT